MHESRHISFRHLAGEHQLMAGTQARWQGGEGFDQAGEIFALIGSAGIEGKGTGDAKFLPELAGGGVINRLRLKVGVDGGSDVNDPISGHIKGAYSFPTGKV